MAASMGVNRAMEKSSLNFGNDCLNVVFSFKENPARFLSMNEVSEESFLFDALQAVFEDKVTESCKLKLLFLIQEHSEVLITTAASLEQALGSFRNLYQKYQADGHNLFRGQILTTMTTILLMSIDHREKSMDAVPLFRELFDDLMKLLLDTNNGNNCLLRAAACQCLVEMEINSPDLNEIMSQIKQTSSNKFLHYRGVGEIICSSCSQWFNLVDSIIQGLLSPIMDCLQDLCKVEKTYIAQHYFILFSLVLRQHKMGDTDPFNKVHQLVSEVTNKCLGVQFKRLNQNANLAICNNSSVQVIGWSGVVTPRLSTVEQKQSLSYLIEHVPLMSTPAALSIIRDAVQLVHESNIVPPSIFKSFLLRSLHSYDISMLHLVLELQVNFGQLIFTTQEQEHLLMHLTRLAKLPCLIPAYRLLLLDWLQQLIQQQADEDNEVSELYLQPSTYPNFIPTVLDGWETITKKFLLLAQLMKNCTKADTSFVLWGTLNFVYDLGNLNMSHRAASTIFRCLSTLVRFHQLSNAEVEATKLVVKFMGKHPRFTSHVFDFICMLKEDFKDSELPRNVQQAVVEFITKTNRSSSLVVLPHYLKILEQIAEENESVCQPFLIVRFLRKLVLGTSVCEQGNWLLGNQILLVCKMILHHHSTKFFFREFGEVLFGMMTTFRDADVQDMARLLYMLLTHISSAKIGAMFDQQLRSSAHLEPFNLATSTTNYSGTRTIISIEDPVLQLVKISPKTFDEPTSTDDGEIDIPKNTLRPYRVYVGGDTFKAVVTVPCDLQIVKEFTEKFDAIYCVDIEIKGPELFGKIDNILVPSLYHNKNCVVSVSFRPSKSVSATLGGCVTFSTKDGETYQSLVTLPTLEFDDFFVPLPIPPAYATVFKTWRHHLFQDLWASFAKSALQGADTSSCQESVILLKLSALKMESVIDRKLKPFVVGATTETDFTLYEIGIFIPPSSHILLRLEVKPANTVCRLVVDQWKLLPMLNQFCLGLEQIVA